MKSEKNSGPVVSVRFTAAELEVVRKAAGDRAVSHFIRSAAVEAAKRIAPATVMQVAPSYNALSNATFVINASGWSGPVTDGLQVTTGYR